MKRMIHLWVLASCLLAFAAASAQPPQPVGAAPVIAQAADEGQYLDLTDGSKAAFKFSNEAKDNPAIGVSRMGGYFTVKYKKTGFGGVCYKAKSTKDVFNLNDWQSVSVDVRIPKQTAVDPLKVVFILYPVKEGSVAHYVFFRERNVIQAGKWYRLVFPIASALKQPSKNPSLPELSTISMLTCGIHTEIEVSDTIETDLRNVRLWKTPVDEVKIEPLEK